MPYYVITDHPLLGPDASALEEPEITVQQRVAEHVLNVAGTALEAGAKLTVEDALALQVRYQVEMGFDALILQSESHGQRSTTFRANLPHALPLAVQLVSRVLDPATAPDPAMDSWRTLRSRRPVAEA